MVDMILDTYLQNALTFTCYIRGQGKEIKYRGRCALECGCWAFGLIPVGGNKKKGWLNKSLEKDRETQLPEVIFLFCNILS